MPYRNTYLNCRPFAQGLLKCTLDFIILGLGPRYCTLLVWYVHVQYIQSTVL